MEEISLGRTWRLGPQIGDRSGFGPVFEAVDGAGTKAAAKFVPKEPGADRELLFVDLADVPNIVPILDSGETDDAFILVMLRAERSLRRGSVITMLLGDRREGPAPAGPGEFRSDS